MPKPALTKKELFELIREQIKHEDDLVNQRLNWLLLSQASLFLALTSIITTEKIDTNIRAWAPFGIAIVGALFNIYSFVGLNAAYKSLRNLRETWYQVNGEETEQGLQNGFPKITWTGKKGQRAIFTATSTPFMILTAWWIIALVSYPAQNLTAKIPQMVVITVIYIWRISVMFAHTQNS